MKKSIFCLIFLTVVSTTIVTAQTVPDSLYYKRVYYAGKVWGFVKYFHSEVAKGNVAWDKELINTLTSIKTATTNLDFNSALLTMLNKAGAMAKPTTPAIELPDSLFQNLDLSWLHDPIFSEEIKSILDTINVRFRPQENYYIGEAFEGGHATFENDMEYYQWGDNTNPYAEKRLLALFRYWNIINYFFPYKYVMDQDWDSTLVEFIPKFFNVNHRIFFQLTFLELAARINDTHASTYSSIIEYEIYDQYILPIKLKYVKEQTIVTQLAIKTDVIEVGDIIKSINGIQIDAIRDSLRKYMAGSNQAAIERNINFYMIRGSHEDVALEIENKEGQQQTISLRRIQLRTYYDLLAKSGPIWKIIDYDKVRCGYVDMGRLKIAHIDTMFSELWNTDGIIFDIRNYPQGTMWHLIRYLFDAPIHIANFSIPDIEYPGTISWFQEYVGIGDFSKTYDNTVVILFNEETQSQAEYTVMALEQHPRSIKIGSQTAGADGNVSTIYLPGGIMTHYSGLGVFYPDGRETQRIGIVPDFEVHPTIEGIREQRDEVLELALQKIYQTHVAEAVPVQVVHHAVLLQNYPNPFNCSTLIKFHLPKPGDVSLTIYNIKGQKIRTLINDQIMAGIHTVKWDGYNDWQEEVSSGVYFMHLMIDRYIQTKKMIFVK